MLDLCPPAGVGEGGGEIVQVGAVGGGQLGAGVGNLGVDGIGAGQVQGHRVEGGEHTHIGNDGNVVFRVAVAVGAYVTDQGDVEMGTAIHNGLGVLGDLVV